MTRTIPVYPDDCSATAGNRRKQRSAVLPDRVGGALNLPPLMAITSDEAVQSNRE